MADMLQAFVKQEMDKQIQEKYPHIQHPSGMYANVVQVKKANDKYICTLKLLDRAMHADNDFPEIPDVKTNLEVKQGNIVVILLLYGGTAVFILGRYEP